MALTESYRLTDRYTKDQGSVFLTGIQALARLPLEQLRADRRRGLDTAAFVSGYPGSPLGGFDSEAARAVKTAPELPVICRPALNEEYGVTAVMGSQLAAARPDARYDGVLGLWYGKAPGVDRAADALRHANYAGTSMHGGAVALVGDDPAAKSSTVPSSSAGLLADMHIPMLYPGDPVEALDLGRHAVALSRASGLWTALKIVADVADGTATIELDPDRVQPVIPLVDGEIYQRTPEGALLTPGTIDIEREIYEVRYELAMQYASENGLNRTTVDPSDAWIGIVASGITYHEVREALHRIGLTTDAEIEACGIRLLRMLMPLPFDPRTVQRFARGLEEVLVIEEKAPNIESLIKDALYAMADHPTVVGKRDETGDRLLPGWGALDADGIIPALRRRLGGRLADRIVPAPVTRERTLIPVNVERTPFYCSGCPHNRSTEVPDGAVVGAGIGCHTMIVMMDSERVGDIAGITCMGNEGTQWIGMADFVETPHLIQNLGDGTYFHSGQLAIQASVAAQTNITYKLLYNGTTAMTGGQDPQGQLGVPEVTAILLAQGVSRVLITSDDPDRYDDIDLPNDVDVWDRTRLIEAQELLATVRGVTVLIHDQACAAELRRDRKRGLIPTPTQRVIINPRICEGCGDCGQVSNCLSVQPIETAFGRKTTIDQTTCNLDYSCLEGDCPSFMTIDEAPGRLDRLAGRLFGRFSKSDADNGALAAAEVTPIVRPQPPEGLPAPKPAVDPDDVAVRITGVGGTGVVTVAQILGTAGMFDGYQVRGLDQIGLSQKAGPVVSDLQFVRGDRALTNRLGERQADALLAFDPLVAASEKGRLVSRRDHTRVVGSISAAPTGEMITHLDVTMPTEEELIARISEVAQSADQHWADAHGITQDLLGDTVAANLFVVGMAVQAGALPLSIEAVEQAITLNGVAVDANLTAFTWGRWQAHDPSVISSARATVPQVAARAELAAAQPELASDLGALVTVCAGDATELERTLRLFTSELVAFQDDALARDYLNYVTTVARRERDMGLGDLRFTDAVARNLYKLLAYKDEYEVARLMLDEAALAETDEMTSDGRTMSWRLHPPMLRALGLDAKISLGPWSKPAVKALAGRKGLRGTKADPFRFAEVRRLERELPGEYREAVDRVLLGLNAETRDAAVAIAELPDHVRGYEDLKVRRVAEYRDRLRAGLAAYPA